MEVKAKWTGRGFALCIGEWKLDVDGKDVTDKIPEDLRTEPMNTYKRYERWYFKDWVEEWESYYDGLKQDEWIEANKYWLDKITKILMFSARSSKQSMKRIFALILVADVFSNKIMTSIYGVVINKFYNKGDIYD